MRLFEQQHLLQLDRLREQYKRTRNARAGLLRGALRELGALVPRGLRDNLPGFQRALRERWTPLPAQMRQVYAQVLDEAQRLQVAMDSVETRLAELTRDDPIVQRLLTIRGVGPLIATAIRASVGDIERFPSGRHLACWLGLTARECSSGAYFSSGGAFPRGSIRTLSRTWLEARADIPTLRCRHHPANTCPADPTFCAPPPGHSQGSWA